MSRQEEEEEEVTLGSSAGAALREEGNGDDTVGNMAIEAIAAVCKESKSTVTTWGQQGMIDKLTNVIEQREEAATAGIIEPMLEAYRDFCGFGEEDVSLDECGSIYVRAGWKGLEEVFSQVPRSPVVSRNPMTPRSPDMSMIRRSGLWAPVRSPRFGDNDF
jgi:hypothetical protein